MLYHSRSYLLFSLSYFSQIARIARIFLDLRNLRNPRETVLETMLETMRDLFKRISVHKIAVYVQVCAYITLTPSLALKLYLFEPVGTEAAVEAT